LTRGIHHVTVVALEWCTGSQEGEISGSLYCASDSRGIWIDIRRLLLGSIKGLEESENIALVLMRHKMMEKLRKYTNE
jgi:hypothetical protein